MSKEFDTSLDVLFGKVDELVSTKTVVGEAIVIGDVTLLPLIEVGVGVGLGQRLRRFRWRYGCQNHTFRRAGNPEWQCTADQHQESGRCQQAYRHGTRRCEQTELRCCFRS